MLCNARIGVGLRVLRELGSIRSEIQEIVVDLHRFNSKRAGIRPWPAKYAQTITAGQSLHNRFD